MGNGEALFLGVLQGLTEFFPISSSGHLVLAEEWLGLQLDPRAMLGVNVLLHAGTLLALLSMYARRWYNLVFSLVRSDAKQRNVLFMVVLATVPAVIIGVWYEESITTTFSAVATVAVSFVVTAVVLWLGERFRGRAPLETVQPTSALAIGMAQAAALLPGISRSGVTISAGRVFGLSRKEAMDFSFLMAVPALAGATVFTLYTIVTEEVVMPAASVLTVSFVASFFSSLFAIAFLQRFVQRHSLAWFSIYLLIASGFLLL